MTRTVNMRAQWMKELREIATRQQGLMHNYDRAVTAHKKRVAAEDKLWRREAKGIVREGRRLERRQQILAGRLAS